MASIRKSINAKGETRYYVQVRLKGHPAETAAFERLSDAKKWIQDTESAIRDGRHFKTSAAKRKTLADAIDRYSKEVLPEKKNAKNIEAYLRYWRKTLGAYTLFDITPALIVEHRNNLTTTTNRFGHTIGKATANRYVQALGHLLNVAMKQWEWINQNPVSRIIKFKEPRGRSRFLSDEERDAVLSACKESKNPYLYMIVVLALSTGARREEIAGLTWSEIDLRKGKIVLDETKNGEMRAIPLQSYALQLIKEHAKSKIKGCPYLFPSAKVTKNKDGELIYQSIDIRTAWENALLRSGIKDFRFHDLRHSAASYLAMNGATLPELAEVLGHKTLQMVKRYAHLSEAHTSTVVAKMNDKIFGGEDGEN